MSKPTGPTTLPPRPSSTNAHEPASGVASVELTASPLGVADANACPTPNEPTRNIIVPNPPPSKEKAGERAIWLIYFLFFAVWLAGYWLGLSNHEGSSMGLPLWFVISCLWAFVGVVLALLYVSRRFFS